MLSITRRQFLKLMAATLAGSLASHKFASAQPAPTSMALAKRKYRGKNLSGWEVVVGDGIYAAPGESPVNQRDIGTGHFKDRSVLRANIQIRRIMAHNITFKRVLDNDALNFTHTAKYKFRLPFQPSTSNADLNGETIEGHLAVWDGGGSRLDHIVAFQWIVNPWAANFGALQVWVTPGQWQTVGQLMPDTNWHEAKMMLDQRKGKATVTIDGMSYPSDLTTMPRPSDWGTEIAARFAAEIISIYPGEFGKGALHKTEFKDWAWAWRPHHDGETEADEEL